MTLYITAIMIDPPGTTPSNITHVWVGNAPAWSYSDVKYSVADMVRKIRAGEQFIVKNATTRVIVVNTSPPHIRTTPDKTPDDNLLALPRRVA
jgi:hypothetical protein